MDVNTRLIFFGEFGFEHGVKRAVIDNQLRVRMLLMCEGQRMRAVGFFRYFDVFVAPDTRAIFRFNGKMLIVKCEGGGVGNRAFAVVEFRGIQRAHVTQIPRHYRLEWNRGLRRRSQAFLVIDAL